jgi:adenosylhomocysteinase
MKNRAILCNSGHFDVEIDLVYLNDTAHQVERNITTHVDAYHMKDGRILYVLGQGRLVNLACAEGHPAQVMDMSFATQAMASQWVAMGKKLPVKVHEVPQEIENEVAGLKLAAMGIQIDSLSEEQKKYLSSWQTGT